MKRCNICGSLCQDYATKCSFCNSEFAPETVKKRPDTVTDLPGSSFNTYKRVIAILLLMAISFLPVPLLAVASDASEDERVFLLFICWALVFFALLGTYFFVLSSVRKNEGDYAPMFHNLRDGDRTDTAAAMPVPSPIVEEAEDQLFFEQPVQRNEPTASDFSIALNTVWRNASYLPLPAYHAEMSCATAANRLAGYTNPFDAHTVRALLAALASRRMIVLCTANTNDLDRIVTGVSTLTGEQLPTVKLNRSCVIPNDLYLAEDSENNSEPSAFLSAIFSAHAHKTSIHPFLLDVETSDKMNATMGDLKPYLENCMSDGKIVVRETNRVYANMALDESVTLPANTRFFFAYRPGRSTLPPKTLMDACAFVTLNTKENTTTVAEKMLGALSFDRLVYLCNEAEERYYLSEENWKKIDDLAQKLSEERSFTLNNKLVTAMERFTGVYMAAGGTEQEALDAVLASILLPAALTSALRADATAEPTAFSQLLDACFGLENLPACAETLKKFNAA